MNRHVISLILVAAAVCSCSRTAKPSPDADVLNVISRISIRKLAVYEMTFDVITQAVETDRGNVALQISTAGQLGGRFSRKILYRGCVSVTYGVDLDCICSNRVQVGRSAITIRLPRPGPIGKPRLVNAGSTRSEVIDRQGPFWDSIRPADISGLEKATREACQRDAQTWAHKYMMDDKVKDRVWQLLSGLLPPGRSVFVEYDHEREMAHD